MTQTKSSRVTQVDIQQQPKRRITVDRVIWGLYVVVTICASLHKYWRNDINNYRIFRTSGSVLLKNGDLYTHHPQFHYDLYKYSPTFAFLMAPFQFLPDIIGVVVWNCLNTLPLLWAIYSLELELSKRRLIALFILIELVTSIQNAQSNGIVAALFILTFADANRGKYVRAGLWVALSGYVKLFGLAALAVFPTFKSRWRLSGSFALWGIALFGAPLIAVSWSYLHSQYDAWRALLSWDHGVMNPMTAVSILSHLTGVNIPINAAQIVGLTLVAAPLVQVWKYGESRFGFLLLSSVMIFVIIFNHKAESPMYVIAMAGVAIWYVTQTSTLANKLLIGLAFVVTSLSSTDLMPAVIRDTYITPYGLKAAPCILVWLKIQWDLWRPSNKLNVAPLPAANVQSRVDIFKSIEKPMRILEIHIEVVDIERSIAFYQKLLPTATVERWRDNSAAAFVLPDGAAFGLWTTGKRGIHNGQAGAHVHFAFQIKPAEYDVYKQRIIDVGATPLEHVWESGQKSVYFFDPDGHQGEFMTEDWLKNTI